MKKGFTLIELLAVIIILVIIAVIATPIVLNSISEARTSANKSSVALFADAIKLKVYEAYFKGQKYPTVDNDWINLNVENGGAKVTCEEAYYDTSYGVILHKCSVAGDVSYNFVDDYTVHAATLYCYAKQTVYTNCGDSTYLAQYTEAKSASDALNGYKDNSGANQPELFNNVMIPVKYEGTSWIYADVKQKWYDYDLKEWANAVLLVKTPSKTYKVGDTILMSDIEEMYVWVPRYKYTIFNGNNGVVPAQEINITFESKTASTGTVTCNDSVNGSGTVSETCTDTTNGTIKDSISTYTHPAFCFGHRTNGVCDGTELKGIWVGKFEMNSSYAIKPNVFSWINAKPSSFFTAIAGISARYNLDANSHMIKNMEWGATTYLTNSKYGLKAVAMGVNPNYNNGQIITGCGAGKGSSMMTTCSTSCTYETTNGKAASTTNNIYGIYDMSGGAYEFVMGNIVSPTKIPIVGMNTTSNSGFNGQVFNGSVYSNYTSGTAFPTSKYYDAYTFSSSSLFQNLGKLGDATKEVMMTAASNTGAWYTSYSLFLNKASSFFLRGGCACSTANASQFQFSASNGEIQKFQSSRAVIVSN